MKIYTRLFEKAPESLDTLEALAKSRYSIEEQAVIAMWGQLLYLVYEDLPTSGRVKPFKQFAIEYIKAWKDDYDELEELNDWISDGDGGRYKDGSISFSKKTIDMHFENASKKTPTIVPMKIKKYGEHASERARWISATGGDLDYSMGNQNIKSSEFELSVGTPIIAAGPWADKEEIIIDKKYIL